MSAAPKANPREIGSTALLISLGIAAMIAGINYEVYLENGLVGPGFMPLVAGGVMTIAGAATLVRSLVPAKKKSEVIVFDDQAAIQAELEAIEQEKEALATYNDKGEKLDTFGRAPKQQTYAVLAIFATLIVSAFLINYIGLFLSLSLMVFVLVFLVEKRKIIPAILATLGCMVFAFVVFKTLLQIPLPTGLLGWI